MATLKDIARKIGVDVSTVSRALNDSSEISKATKALIRKAANAVNYVPDVAARALVGKPTKSVGLIIPEVTSDYYAQIANAVEAELRQRGYSMIMGITDFRYDLELSCLNTLSSHKADGILFVSGMHPRLRIELERVKANFAIPIVLMDPIRRVRGYDCLKVDNRPGIEQAVGLFCRQNRRHVGFIGDAIASRGRFPSFEAALRKNDRVLEEKYVRITEKRFERGGYESMLEVLKETPLPDAIFVAYDDMAIGVLKAIYEAGLSIPKDIEVIGYDNIRHSEFLYQPLSTILPDVAEMTAAGVTLLMDRIAGHGPRNIRNILIRSQLVLRETTESEEMCPSTTPLFRAPREFSST